MKILFYFFKNVHIPLFVPIIGQLASEPGRELYFAAPAYDPRIREGLSPPERESLNSLPGKWLNHPDEIQADAAVMADCVAERLAKHRFIVNIGHGLISKGQYFSDSPLIGRENLADLLCVPGPWHKEQLEPMLYIPVEATGMSKLDVLFQPFDKLSFCARHRLDPYEPIILWAPTFNMELSGIPVIWTQIRKLTELGQVLIKLHGTTDVFLSAPLRQLAMETPRLFYVEHPDVTPFMRAADLLITDVSSVMFEYLALDRPLVLVDNPHTEQYANYNPEDVEYKWRDIGPRVKDPNELFAAVAEQLAEPQSFQAARKRCVDKMFVATDGRSAERIAEAVMQYAKRGRPRQRYDVVVDFAATDAQIQQLRRVVAPDAQLLIDDVTTGDAPFVVVFTRPAIMLPGWEKPLLGPLQRLADAPQVVGAISTGDGAKLSGVFGYLSAHKAALPKQLTPENLSALLRYSNAGESQRVPIIDSAVYATKKDCFVRHRRDGPLTGPNSLRKVITSDVLAVEVPEVPGPGV